MNIINNNLILNHIKQNKMTIGGFCKKCKICKSTFYKIMNNQTNVNIVALFKIARELNVEIKELFEKNCR